MRGRRVASPFPSLAGVEKQFLFDTGGYFTQVSPAVADELKLKRRESYIEIYGVNGSKSRSMVTVPTFAIGPVHGTNYEIPVWTDNEIAGIFTPVGFTQWISKWISPPES